MATRVQGECLVCLLEPYYQCYHCGESYCGECVAPLTVDIRGWPDCPDCKWKLAVRTLDWNVPSYATDEEKRLIRTNNLKLRIR